MLEIHQSVKGYEGWLRRQLGRDVVENDLAQKHDKMRESPFAFLRATGADLAGVHLGTADQGAAIARGPFASQARLAQALFDESGREAVATDHAAWTAAKTSTK